MSDITVTIHGRACELPAKYRPQYDEGKQAGGRRFNGLPQNPYQSEYTATGALEALWKAVAWFQGFRSTLHK